MMKMKWLEDISNPPRWVVISGGLAVLGITFVVLKKRKAAKAKAKSLELAPQVERKDVWQHFANRPIGSKDLPLMHGVRVVDFASHVASPNLSRILAELGAEVIKVEPPTGDLLRQVFLDFELERKKKVGAKSAMFESCNLGKYSICLDIKKPEDYERLKGLLESADVLITNIRGLEKLDLHYEGLAKEFPHLIYASVSAWGKQGPDSGLAGYDIGAFWTGTGLSALLNDEKDRRMSLYPAASGDLCTSQMLLSGICNALAQRVTTGRGACVSTSLLHCGAWCVSPYIIEEEERHPVTEKEPFKAMYDERPPVNPVHCVYTCSDDEHVCVCHLQGEGHLMKALGLKELSFEKASEVIGTWTLSKTLQKFRSAGVIHRKYVYTMDLWKHVNRGDGYHQPDPSARSIELEAFVANLEKAPKGISDMKYVHKVPYEFSAQQSAHSMKPAPYKGEDTDSVLKHGWFSRHESCLLPKKATGKTLSGDGLVSDCTIVELQLPGDYSVAASSRTFVQQGARVVRIEGETYPDAVDPNESPVYREYTRGKEVVKLLNPTDTQEIARVLRETKANMFFTNAMDVNVQSLGELVPDVVILQVKSYRAGYDANTYHGWAAMWCPGNLGTCFSGKPPSKVACPPEHCLELLASFYISAAASIGYFHLKRTGKGQVISVFYDGIGHYMTSLVNSVVHADPGKSDSLFMLGEDFSRYHPVPTYNSFKLKDGIWIQLLGVNMARHLHRTLAVSNAVASGYLSLIWTVLTKVVPNRKEKSLMAKAKPVFGLLNGLIAKGLGNLTFAEFQEKAKAHDVWFTVVRAPVQLLDYAQCKENNVFEIHGKHDVHVACPIKTKQL